MSNKIVFFVTNLDSGGLENYLLRFLTTYSVRFEDVVIFCKGGRGGVLEEQYLNLVNVRVKKQKIGNYHVHHYLYLANWLRSYRDYSICDFTGNFAGPVLIAAAYAGISNRLVFYRSSSNRFKEDLFRMTVNNIYNRLVRKFSTQILVNSSYAIKFFFKKQPKNEVKVIYNGIDPRAFNKHSQNLRACMGLDEQSFVIGHTGRFNPAKNHKIIVEIADELITSYPNFVFILCGNGVKDGLTEEVERRGLGGSVLLFNNRTDIPAFLNTCDVYLFPSLTEGQPNSLIEAWIKGIPFVASDIPPISDVLPQRFRKHLCDPFDRAGFKQRVIEIYNGAVGEEERDDLSNWAKKAFDADTRFAQFYEVLTERCVLEK